MDPIFLYFDKLTFDKDKNFTLEFSNDDNITEVLLKQSKDYSVINIDCFIELSSDIKSSTLYKESKEVSDKANNISTKGVDFGFKFDYLIVKHFLWHD